MRDPEDYLTAVAFAADAVSGHAAAIEHGTEPDPDGDRVDRWIGHYAHVAGVDANDIRTALNP